MARPYDAAGMMAMRDGSGALTSRAKNSRARAASVKKSSAVIVQGLRLREAPATPAASTGREIGDM